jgi:single-strand DNA-binding protein
MYQRIEIIGNLGKEPEMKFTPSGQSVTSFSVATTNQYKDKNGEAVKETTWFRVQVWGAQAENCHKYLAKGSKVFVAGRMVADKATGAPKIWTKGDGTSGASFEINAQEVKFLSSVEKTEQAAQPAAQLADEEPYPF